MAKTTQSELVLAYIRTYGSITQLEAMRDFGIMRLASRISDLRRRGIKIKSEIVEGTNRFGQPIHFARYTEVVENNGNA